MNLRDATCIVTGGTEGIGRAIAEALGGRGARVALCARTASTVEESVTALRDAGVRTIGRVCDVSDEHQVVEFVDVARAELGPIDVLVNNAGLAHWGPADEMTVAAFDETMAVNVRGIFLMTRAVLPEMKARKHGHIVNIASLAGRNPVPNAAAYSASKHAVLGFSKSVFAEVRQFGVRVTAVCPGSVVTPFSDKGGHHGMKNPERKLQAGDVAHSVIAVLELPDRALLSELDLRPTTP